MLATLFINPIELPSWAILWAVLPLCLAASIVYKTVRVSTLDQLPREILHMFAYILAGLIIMGALLYAILAYFGHSTGL